jgi:hypothetical protein
MNNLKSSKMKETKQQTAVEWLFNQLFEKRFLYRNKTINKLITMPV